MNQSTTSTGGGGSATLLGILTMLLGVLCLISPMFTGFSILMLIGILMVAGGIMRMVWAFGASSVGYGVLRFIFGVLTLLAGIAVLSNPALGAGVLTIVLAIYFIIDGISEVGGSFQLKPTSGWFWMLLGGIVSIALGIMIWRQFPFSGTVAIGVLLGIKLFFVGLIMLTAGTAARDA